MLCELFKNRGHYCYYSTGCLLFRMLWNLCHDYLSWSFYWLYILSFRATAGQAWERFVNYLINIVYLCSLHVLGFRHLFATNISVLWKLFISPLSSSFYWMFVLSEATALNTFLRCVKYSTIVCHYYCTGCYASEVKAVQSTLYNFTKCYMFQRLMHYRHHNFAACSRLQRQMHYRHHNFAGCSMFQMLRQYRHTAWRESHCQCREGDS